MKNYLFILLCSISISLFGQLDGADSESATVIWSEDFNNGFPNGWNTYSNNTGAGNNGASNPGNNATCPWKHSTQGSWGYWNSVGTSGGNPTGPADPINSSTALNGFLISDIDSANHWNGNPGSSSGSTYHYLESYFVTSPINTVGYPNIALEFQQNFRLNNGVDLVVSISPDSISWTDFFVQGDAANNQESENPEIISLNISCVAGDQPNVYIKIGWTARVYYWMIDDMQIVELMDNKLNILEANYGGWYTTPTTNGFGLTYSHTPINQAIENPFTFEGIVTNNGGMNQLTRINVDVIENSISGATIFSTTSADSTIYSQDINCEMDTVTFVGNDRFTPSTTGLYYFNTWASSPDTLTSIITDSTIVTDTIYARDLGVDNSEYGLGRSCGGMIIGTYFDIYDTDDITSISVFIKDNSVAGSDIYVQLYEIDPTGGRLVVSQSDDYELQPNDIGNWVTIPLLTPYLATPKSYMAAVGGYQHAFDTTIVGMSQYTWPTTCYIQKNGCLNSGQTFGSWYWLSRVPMIRINTGELPAPSSIYENNFNGIITAFPNPSKGNFTLRFDNVANDIYVINISDLLGKNIFSTSIRINGYLEESIDISSFGQGTYFIEVFNTNTSVVETITIE